MLRLLVLQVQGRVARQNTVLHTLSGHDAEFAELKHELHS